MPFKPMTKTALAKQDTEADDPSKLPVNEHPTDVVKNTTERIRIIFDDSSSMRECVRDDQGNFKASYELAADGTVDYMKSCTPKTTGVTIDFLNQFEIPLTRNLPKIAPEVKQKAGHGGGTPMNQHLDKLVSDQAVNKFTRALIFSDGEFFVQEQTIMNCLELGIPIDFILIGDYNESTLSGEHNKVKELAEKSKGVFMICKDGAIFKAKLKYFAPPLRHLLTSVASKEN